MQGLTQSEKDYMEVLYVLLHRFGSVRSVDIAGYMELSKPSVTRAIQKLRSKGYVEKKGHDLVFTESGKKVVEHIVERHCVLTNALRKIGFDKEMATEEAKRIERVASEEVIASLASTIQCQKWLTGNCPIHVDILKNILNEIK